MKSTYFILILTALSSINCGDNSYHYSFEVKNNTNKIVHIDYTLVGQHPDSIKLISLVPNASRKLTQVQSNSTKRNPPDIYPDTIYLFSYLSAVGYDSIRSVKNFRLRSEWNYSSADEFMGYYLSIDTTDFIQ